MIQDSRDKIMRPKYRSFLRVFRVSCFLSPESPRSGFTLVEMMVAVGIFAIIMMIAVGGFLSLLEANYKARAVKTVVNNLHFAFENMTRNLRTGSVYHCDVGEGVLSESRDCPNGAPSIGFKDKEEVQTVYQLKNAGIERSVGGATFVSLTSPEIIVESLLFFVANSADGKSDKNQPIVRILANGTMKKEKSKVPSPFTIETLVSQRLLDI